MSSSSSVMPAVEHLNEQLRGYMLDSVVPTGKKVGYGAYGYVEEVEVSGTICAAKKVHRVLIHNRDEGVEVFKIKFYSECKIMSMLRHPHVVQFLGVHFPSAEQIEREEIFEASAGSVPLSSSQGLSLPWLIMEYLPMNLDNFLKGNPSIPFSVKTSLLLDISKGLNYLHNQNPAIIHRDLTAKNILINSSLVAKIADFGVARIVDPMSNMMSAGPGAIIYMPPEVHSRGEAGGRHAHYSTSIDIFSFGVNILYTITQECPTCLQPAVITNPNDHNQLIAVNEIIRREKYFAKAHSILMDPEKPEHRLIVLAKACLHNSESQRPNINDLLLELKKIKEEIPDELLERSKFELMENFLATRNVGESTLCNGIQEPTTLQERDRNLPCLETENEHLRVMVDELVGDRRELEEENLMLERHNRQLDEEKRRIEALLRHREQELSIQRIIEVNNEKRRSILQQELETCHVQKTAQIERLEQQLLREREISEDCQRAIVLLEEQLKEESASVNNHGNEQLRRDIEFLEQQIMHRDAENLALKSEAQLLREQMIQKAESFQRNIAELEKQLSSKNAGVMCSSFKPPPLPESGITVKLPLFWRRCDPVPSSFHCGQCITYDSCLLYGGGKSAGDNRKIFRFDFRRKRWEDFSTYYYEYFAMVVVKSNKLLLVGGYNPVKDEYSSRVSEWRENNWVNLNDCPLPTPRSNAVAVGFRNFLIVAGGFNGKPLDRVDILDIDSLGQWHSLASLPEPAYGLQSCVFRNTSRTNNTTLWYLVSTNRGCSLDRRRPVFSISLRHLVEGHGTWAVLPDPPLSNCGAVTVKGHLLAIGGHDQHATKKDMHMYFHGTNEWLRVGELQHSRDSCSCVALSDSKFVVVGGKDDEKEYSGLVYQYDVRQNS